MQIDRFKQIPSTIDAKLDVKFAMESVVLSQLVGPIRVLPGKLRPIGSLILEKGTWNAEVIR